MDTHTPGGSPIHWFRPRRQKPKTTCPLCGKKVSVVGMRDHVEAKHSVKRFAEGRK